MPQAVNQAAIHLQTSGQKLRSILQQLGHNLNGYQKAEKLDLLSGIIDQIQYKLEHGQKMALSLPEINQVLKTEGMEPGKTPKSAITLLWNLRELQMDRLRGYVTPRKLEEPPLWLAVIPDNEINKCITWDPSTSPPQPSPQYSHDSPSPQPCANNPSLEPCAKHGNAQQTVDTGSNPPKVSLIASTILISSPSENLLAADQPVTRSASGKPVVPDSPVAARVVPGRPSELESKGIHVDGLSFKTSVSDLKTMFLKTGLHPRFLQGEDKLDMLMQINDQVKYCIKHGRKMQLTIADLNAFNEREGMPQHEDAIEAVKSLLEFRRLHLDKRAHRQSLSDADLKEYDQTIFARAEAVAAEDNEFIEGVLMVIATEKVSEVFAAASPKRGQKRQGDGIVGAEERAASTRCLDVAIR